MDSLKYFVYSSVAGSFNQSQQHLFFMPIQENCFCKSQFCKGWTLWL